MIGRIPRHSRSWRTRPRFAQHALPVELALKAAALDLRNALFAIANDVGARRAGGSNAPMSPHLIGLDDLRPIFLGSRLATALAETESASIVADSG